MRRFAARAIGVEFGSGSAPNRGGGEGTHPGLARPRLSVRAPVLVPASATGTNRAERPTMRAERRSLIRRVWRAMRLDPSVYREVGQDEGATGQAIAVVGAVALAHGLGDVLRAVLASSEFDDNPATAWLFGVPAEISFWVAASMVIMGIGSLLGARRTYPTVVRSFGFAAAPGLLIVVAALVSASLPPLVVLAPIAVLRLAAAFLAVRASLAWGSLRSAVTLVLAVAAGLAAASATARLVGSVID
jgi:hypothetical protein